MGNKHDKRPKAVEAPGRLQKQPKAVADTSPGYHGKTPSWRFGLLDLAGPFGWDVPRERKAELAARSRDLERMTWGEILRNDNTGTHSIPTERLSKEARGRLVELKLDDRDTMISLRVNGKTRVWGFLDDAGILSVVWWDPEHLVCPSAKKHT